MRGGSKYVVGFCRQIKSFHEFWGGPRSKYVIGFCGQSKRFSCEFLGINCGPENFQLDFKGKSKIFKCAMEVDISPTGATTPITLYEGMLGSVCSSGNHKNAPL